MRDTKILVSFGTRPEAIKMFPVVKALRKQAGVETRIAVTAQHREMLDSVLDIAEIVPDIDLDLMEPGQDLDSLAARILTRFGAVLDQERPDRVLVHGDTLTTMMVSIACYFRKIPVGHVEAGLRSGNIYSPWPEEVNRKATGVIADLHFAPTQRAADALLAEAVDRSQIHVTGNTVIDALLLTRDALAKRPDKSSPIRQLIAGFPDKKIIAVTAHRRENFGDGMRDIAEALAQLASREDVAIIYPLHPNPNVAPVMKEMLGDSANIALIEPLDYPEFVQMMDASYLILTDSGGIQEEAPSLGKPVLVMRDTTERPEAIEAGTARLVGTAHRDIVKHASQLLDDHTAYAAMAQAHNPFGEGHAAQLIAQITASETAIIDE